MTYVNSFSCDLSFFVDGHIALITLAFAEGLVFARGTGVDTRTFVRVLNSTYFKTGISERKGPRIVDDDYNPSFHLMNMVKDLDLALRTAYTSGLTLPVTTSAEAVYRASEAFGLSKMDYTSVASYLLKLNGLNAFRTDNKRKIAGDCYPQPGKYLYTHFRSTR